MSAPSLIASKGIICNIERRTEASDAAGSQTGTWAVNIANARVFVQPASGSESLRYGRESNRGFVICFTEVGQDIIAADRLTGVDLGTRILDIQSVRTPGQFTSGRLAHMVLECEETA